MDASDDAPYARAPEPEDIARICSSAERRRHPLRPDRRIRRDCSRSGSLHQGHRPPGRRCARERGTRPSWRCLSCPTTPLRSSRISMCGPTSSCASSTSFPTIDGASCISINGASHCRVGPAAGGRGVSGRHGTSLDPPGSRPHLRRGFRAPSGGYGHRRGLVRTGESLAESVRRARDRVDPTGVSASRHCLERFASSARPHVVHSLLSRQPHAPRARKRTPRIADQLLRHLSDPSSPCLKPAVFTTATNDALRSPHRPFVQAAHQRSSRGACVSAWRVLADAQERRRSRVENATSACAPSQSLPFSMPSVAATRPALSIKRLLANDTT